MNPIWRAYFSKWVGSTINSRMDFWFWNGFFSHFCEDHRRGLPRSTFLLSVDAPGPSGAFAFHRFCHITKSSALAIGKPLFFTRMLGIWNDEGKSDTNNKDAPRLGPSQANTWELWHLYLSRNWIAWLLVQTIHESWIIICRDGKQIVCLLVLEPPDKWPV